MGTNNDSVIVLDLLNKSKINIDLSKKELQGKHDILNYDDIAMKINNLTERIKSIEKDYNNTIKLVHDNHIIISERLYVLYKNSTMLFEKYKNTITMLNEFMDNIHGSLEISDYTTEILQSHLPDAISNILSNYQCVIRGKFKYYMNEASYIFKSVVKLIHDSSTLNVIE